VRKHTIDEVRRRVRHSPAAAGMAETPPFTRKTDCAIQTACTAMDANETSRQNSAVQERTEFGFD
jgi:hypothetical protein